MKDWSTAGHYLVDAPKGGTELGRPTLASKEQEFEALFDGCRGRVLAFALRRVDPDEAKEVVSDTFLVAWRRFSDIPSEPLPWLLAVARKVIATRTRGYRRKASLQSRLLDDIPKNQPEHYPEERLHLAEAFNSLSDKDREVLMLVGWDGLTISEAAQVFGSTPESFSLRLHRARKRLQARMEASHREPFLAQHAVVRTEETR